MNKLSILIICNFLLLVSCEKSTELTTRGPNSQQRSIAFKKIATNIKVIDDILNGNKPYNVEEFKQIANDLYQSSKEPFKYMVDDGEYKNGKAKQEIWSLPEKFNLKKNNFLNAVENFNKNAQTADLNKIKISFSKVEESCKSCHSVFKKSN